MRGRGEHHFRIPFSVNATATMRQVCDFLYEFRSTDLLHRVTRMTIDSSPVGGGVLITCRMQVEAIAIVDNANPDRVYLFEDDVERTVELAMSRDDYEPIIRRNIFWPRKKVEAAQTTTTPPERVKSTPRVDAAKSMYLIGVFRDADRREAWLYNRRMKKNQVLEIGDTVKQSDIEGRVVEIESDAILLEVDGERRRLRLGQNLREMKRVAEPEAA